MSKQVNKQTRIAVLKAKYRTLSALCSEFPKNSKHKAFLKINSDMEDIIDELETLEAQKGEGDKMNHEFYLITCKGERGAKVRQSSFEIAEKEAHRIARKEKHPTWILGVVAKIEPVIQVETKTILK